MALQERSAGVVVFSGKPRRYLVLLKKNRADLPKGKLEAGESWKDAALRELREETGLKNVRLVPGYRKRRLYKYARDGKPVQKTVTFFLAESPSRKVRFSKEHKGFLWLSPKEAQKRLWFKNYCSLIEQAEKLLG